MSDADSDGPPLVDMYLPPEQTRDLHDSQLHSRYGYAETPMPTHDELDSVSLLPSAIYILVFVLVIAHFWILVSLQKDMAELRLELLSQLVSIETKIKPVNWVINAV
jgi:hypothetical protein